MVVRLCEGEGVKRVKRGVRSGEKRKAVRRKLRVGGNATWYDPRDSTFLCLLQTRLLPQPHTLQTLARSRSRNTITLLSHKDHTLHTLTLTLTLAVITHLRSTSSALPLSSPLSLHWLTMAPPFVVVSGACRLLLGSMKGAQATSFALV